MGIESLHAEIIKKSPVCINDEKLRSTTGLVCPVHVRGICLGRCCVCELFIDPFVVLILLALLLLLVVLLLLFRDGCDPS